MNWINNAVVGLITRHLLTLAGGWLAAKGILNNDDTAKAYAAVVVLLGVGHSMWSKRETIIAEVKGLLSGNPLPVLLIGATLAFGDVGCKSYQVVNATSGSGLNMDASVPIPMSGGESLIGLKLIAGFWKNGTVVQPTSTNIITAPSVAINLGTAGNASASGSASATGAGTNGVAGLGATDTEHLTLLTGEATQTNATSALTTAK